MKTGERVGDIAHIQVSLEARRIAEIKMWNVVEEEAEFGIWDSVWKVIFRIRDVVQTACTE
jgi:hypothetical protein